MCALNLRSYSCIKSSNCFLRLPLFPNEECDLSARDAPTEDMASPVPVPGSMQPMLHIREETITLSRINLEFSAIPTSTGSSLASSYLCFLTNARIVPRSTAAKESEISFIFQNRQSFSAGGARLTMGNNRLSAVLSNDPKSRLFSREKNSGSLS